MSDIYKLYKKKRGIAKNRPHTWLAWLQKFTDQESIDIIWKLIFSDYFESGWYFPFIPILQFQDMFDEGWIDDNPTVESSSDNFENEWFINNSFNVIQISEQFETNWFYINQYDIFIGSENFEDSSWE